MNPDDRAYINESIACLTDWIKAVSPHDPTDPISEGVYFQCIAESAERARAILQDGVPSPWRGDVPHDYVAVMQASRAAEEQP